MSNNEKSIFEQMGGTYHLEGEVLIPDLELPPQPTEDIGKYGRMRKAFLEEHQPTRYGSLILDGTLFWHLLEVQHQATAMLEDMMPKLAEACGATEELKATDQMKWVGLMNTCKAQVEEIIQKELIYV